MSEVVYLESADTGHHESLNKLIISESNLSQDEIFEIVNYNVFHQMGCGNSGIPSDERLAGKLKDYRKILTELCENRSISFKTGLELSTQTPEDGQVFCHLRHDVDADIVSCLPMAIIESELGISSTYYLLHTASYYGSWSKGDGQTIFQRNSNLGEFYLELQNLGHEIGIHTDPLSIYQDWNTDGSLALLAEIKWLRSIGIVVSGTAPHNNPDVYGASNSAIFKGKPVSETVSSEYKAVIKDGKWAPLGVLDEADLGLVYEADEVYKKPIPVDFISMIGENNWWRMYRHPSVYSEILKMLELDPGTDASQIMIDRHPTIYSDKDSFHIRGDFVASAVAQLPPKTAILSIHPEYYGWRDSEFSSPTL